jgi:hypothetical protein
MTFTLAGRARLFAGSGGFLLFNFLSPDERIRDCRKLMGGLGHGRLACNSWWFGNDTPAELFIAYIMLRQSTANARLRRPIRLAVLRHDCRASSPTECLQSPGCGGKRTKEICRVSPWELGTHRGPSWQCGAGRQPHPCCCETTFLCARR